MIKIICDRCGGEIKSNPVRIVPSVTKEDGISFGYEGWDITRDYCEKCVESILKFMNGVHNAVDQEKNDNKIEQNKERKRKYKTKRTHLDLGKIIALKNAGWSNSKIADEIGTTSASIASTIYNYKNKLVETPCNL